MSESAEHKADVVVPDIGEAEDVEVIELCAAPGDPIAVDDPLIVIESDKASMEVPSPFAGTLGDLRVALGDVVNAGDVIATVLLRGVAPSRTPGQPSREPARGGRDRCSRRTRRRDRWGDSPAGPRADDERSRTGCRRCRRSRLRGPRGAAPGSRTWRRSQCHPGFRTARADRQGRCQGIRQGQDDRCRTGSIAARRA